MPPAFNLSQDQTLQFNPTYSQFTDDRFLPLPRWISPSVRLPQYLYVTRATSHQDTHTYRLSRLLKNSLHSASPQPRAKAAEPRIIYSKKTSSSLRWENCDLFQKILRNASPSTTTSALPVKKSWLSVARGKIKLRLQFSFWRHQ